MSATAWRRRSTICAGAPASWPCWACRCSCFRGGRMRVRRPPSARSRGSPRAPIAASMRDRQGSCASSSPPWPSTPPAGARGAVRARCTRAAATAQIERRQWDAMQYLLLGFAALLLFLLAARAYSMANPHALARQLRIGAGVAALAGAGILVLRGLVGFAISLATLGAWLLWGHGGPLGPRGQTQKAPGQTSRVTTEHLEVDLDHDSGDI